MDESQRKIIRQKIVEGFTKYTPFHQFLGLSEESFDAENGCIRFSMRDEFVGNSMLNVLHGGIIAAILDAEGGFLGALDVFTNRETPVTRNETTAKGGGTIDMRVDYLMPGKGEHFIASGTILRKGNQILAIRTELHNEKNELIAIGTATYKIPGAGPKG